MLPVFFLTLSSSCVTMQYKDIFIYLFIYLHVLNSPFKVHGDIPGTSLIMFIFINKISIKNGRGKYPICFFNQQFIAHCFLENIPASIFLIYLIIKCIDRVSLLLLAAYDEVKKRKITKNVLKILFSNFIEG